MRSKTRKSERNAGRRPPNPGWSPKQREKQDNERARKLLKSLIEEIGSGGFASRAIFDVLAFLRGPDCPPLPASENLPALKDRQAGQGQQDQLKELTTRRVRYMIGMKGSPVLVRALPLSEDEAKLRDRLLNRVPNLHFYQHYARACSAVRQLYGYDLATEKPAGQAVYLPSPKKKPKGRNP